MAIPMNRFTVAVANFCDSGAGVPNGNRTATSVARAMIHPKKTSGRGVVSSRRCRSPVAIRATPAAPRTYSVVCASPYAPALGRSEDGDVEEPPESKNAEQCHERGHDCGRDAPGPQLGRVDASIGGPVAVHGWHGHVVLTSLLSGRFGEAAELAGSMLGRQDRDHREIRPQRRR